MHLRILPGGIALFNQGILAVAGRGFPYRTVEAASSPVFGGRTRVKLRLKSTSHSRASVCGEPSLGGRLRGRTKTASKAHQQELASIVIIRALEDV